MLGVKRLVALHCSVLLSVHDSNHVEPELSAQENADPSTAGQPKSSTFDVT